MRAGLLCLLVAGCERTSQPPAPTGDAPAAGAPASESSAAPAEPAAPPLPRDPGLHVRVGTTWQAPPRSLLALRADEPSDGVRTRGWCLDRDRSRGLSLPAGTTLLVDDPDARWRPFRLDGDGCAWRERRDARERWEITWRRQPTTEETRLPDGRRLTSAELDAGDWFLADWDEGFFTQAQEAELGEDPPAEPRFTGAWLQVDGT